MTRDLRLRGKSAVALLCHPKRFDGVTNLEVAEPERTVNPRRYKIDLEGQTDGDVDRSPGTNVTPHQQEALQADVENNGPMISE